ncbi:1372_t:CDS:2 [Cetraspora pellucida]|uniref:1372_t:CDS:1 n=1 Tax=Cetraspora pellucida TaxID=1433469 RepID=A0ACA9KCF9_9GLOM|nr:1372_t:CDS:2 [Cetraspora pellucida]
MLAARGITRMRKQRTHIQLPGQMSRHKQEQEEIPGCGAQRDHQLHLGISGLGLVRFQLWQTYETNLDHHKHTKKIKFQHTDINLRETWMFLYGFKKHEEWRLGKMSELRNLERSGIGVLSFSDYSINEFINLHKHKHANIDFEIYNNEEIRRKHIGCALFKYCWINPRRNYKYYDPVNHKIVKDFFIKKGLMHESRNDMIIEYPRLRRRNYMHVKYSYEKKSVEGYILIDKKKIDYVFMRKLIHMPKKRNCFVANDSGITKGALRVCKKLGIAHDNLENTTDKIKEYIKETKTSYYRSADSVLNSSSRDGEKGDERDRSEEDNQPKPQFRDECFRKMDLMIEFTNLRNPRHCPSGVYVMPSADNFYIWYGVLFVHKGYYKGGVFKFKLNIPIEYPFL